MSSASFNSTYCSFDDSKVVTNPSGCPQPLTVRQNISFEQDVDYPGKGATFQIEEEGCWKISLHPKIVRQLVFSTLSTDSLFSKIRILGFRTGTIALEAILRTTPSQPQVDYFTAKLGEECFSRNADKTIIVQEESLPILFRILEENNSLPNVHHVPFRELVATNDWTLVTPLQPGEFLTPLRSSRH